MVGVGINLNEILKELKIDPKKFKNRKFNNKPITEGERVTIDLSIDTWVTLRTKDYKEFFGEYHYSKNKEYCVVFQDRGDGGKILGEVILIKNQIVKWRKAIERPHGAFVNNKGNVVVIDWLDKIHEAKKLAGKVWIFNNAGKQVFEETFNSNIGDQKVSSDCNEFIVTTCFPENAIYLFNLKDAKLIKKVENNTPIKPLHNFNFEEIKSYVLKCQEFNQKEYDTKEQQRISGALDGAKNLELLMEKKIDELNDGELVKVGSFYAGDFYGNFGNPKKAINYLLKAIELKGDKPQPYALKLAAFCYEKIEDYKNAIKYCELALKRYPAYKKSVVVDHLEFCNLKLNKKIKKDWTTFIIEKREKENN